VTMILRRMIWFGAALLLFCAWARVADSVHLAHHNTARAQASHTHKREVPTWDQFIIPGSAFSDAHDSDPLRDPMLYPPAAMSPAAVSEWIRRDMRRQERAGENPNANRLLRTPNTNLPFKPGTYYGLLESQAGASQKRRASRLDAALRASAHSRSENQAQAQSQAALRAKQQQKIRDALRALESSESGDQAFIYPMSPDSS